MIQSEYILNILDLAFDDHRSEDLLRSQIHFLSQEGREHTGTGIFIFFVAKSGIEEYKAVDTEGNLTEGIAGVEVRNQELNIFAEAIVHVKNGFIDHIEIWNKNGEDYPETEPVKYELSQAWAGKTKRQTILK